VPFWKFCAILRAAKYVSLLEKSAQRGIDTAQSHCLYASSQSAQVFAKEYCALEVVLHGICSKDLVKFL
jgi:hypothetical protein